MGRLAHRAGVVLCVLCFYGVAYCQEQPEKVTVCQLKNAPPAYNHKLIEVTAFVSHDFEDFTVFDPACPSWPDVWLEYGGTSKSGTMYCCGVTDDRLRRAVYTRLSLVVLIGSRSMPVIQNVWLGWLLLPINPVATKIGSSVTHLYFPRCHSRYASLFPIPRSFATFFSAVFSSAFSSAMISRTR
jgi:hypothetical protein